MRTSTGLMLTCLALFSDAELPFGRTAQLAGLDSGDDNPLRDSFDRTLRAHWGLLKQREQLRPDRNLEALYAGLYDLEARG